MRLSSSFILAFALLPASGAEECSLIRNSQPVMEVIYANEATADSTPKAEQEERLSANVQDFCQILQRISGVTLKALPAMQEAGKGPENTIQVGWTPAAIKAGLVNRAKALKPHTLLIHTDPKTNTIYLLGSTLEGSGHAMYELLERLGCRWFMPGAFGEQLPKMTTVSIQAMDLVREPEFELRDIQLGSVGSVAKNSPGRAEFMEWMRRNKFGGSQPKRGHSFPKLVPEKKYFQEHPEYYALKNGKRDPMHLCMTHPGTLQAAEETLVEFFTKNPKAEGFPVALADGIRYCECPECTKATGGNPKKIINLYLDFNRTLFDRIDKKFPNREFQYGTYVYANLLDFPDVSVPKQMAPFMAPLSEDCFHEVADPQLYTTLGVARYLPLGILEKTKGGFRSESAQFVNRLIQSWANGTKNLYMRDYDPYMTMGQNMPVFRPYQLAIEIPWYKSIGFRGFIPEAVANSWFASGLNYYIRSRYYWDVKADIHTVLEDYCKGMFGKAARPMRQYLDALALRTLETEEYRAGDESLTRVYPLEWVRGLEVHLAEAERLATTDQEKARVRMGRLNQEHMLKYLETRNAELAGDFIRAAVLGREYLKLLDEIHAVNPHFVAPEWYVDREFSIAMRQKEYEKQASLMNGDRGSFISRLPLKWSFKHDPQDVGITEKWFNWNPQDPAVGDGAPPGWKLQATSKSWQTRKDQYAGYNWYRTQCVIPSDLKGKPVSMLVAGIFGHMDFFINGQRVTWIASTLDKNGQIVQRETAHLDLSESWSRNYNASFEVPIGKYFHYGGTNTFCFRTRDKKNWGGIFKTASLFIPKQESSPPCDPIIPWYTLEKIKQNPEALQPEDVPSVDGEMPATPVHKDVAKKTSPPAKFSKKQLAAAKTFESTLEKMGNCDCSHTMRNLGKPDAAP